jgi:hypothetical protein
MAFGQVDLEKGEKQPTPFNTKQKECTCKIEVEEDPNGRHKGIQCQNSNSSCYGGEGAKGVIMEPRALLECRV